MTIPSRDLATTSTVPFSPFPHTLKVGELKIGERSYTVSIESSDPFISTPKSDTIEKIQYLVDLHLTHLKSQDVDLSKIVIQQLDEEGLSYVNEDLEQKSLQSSKLNFVSFNPLDESSSFPISLQNQSISSISDIYRSIIESLTKKSEEQEEETHPTSTRESPSKRIIFTTKSEEPLIENSDEQLHNVENYPTIQTEDETIGLISGEPKDFSQNNQSGIKAWLYNLPSTIWNSLPSLRPDNTDEPIIDTQKIIEEKQSRFRNGFSESQKANFDKFTNINLQ